MQIQPKLVAEYKDLVLECLNDEDITIRQRALDLLSIIYLYFYVILIKKKKLIICNHNKGGIVSKKTLPDITKKLLSYIANSDGDYRDELISTLINICSVFLYLYLYAQPIYT